MAARTALLALAPVMASALTEAAGATRLSFYLLLAAVPLVALAALLELGEVAERGPISLDTFAQLTLTGAVLIGVLVAASARADIPAYGHSQLAVSALIGCLGAFGLKAFCSLAFGGVLLPQTRLQRGAPAGQRRAPGAARERRRLAA